MCQEVWGTSFFEPTRTRLNRSMKHRYIGTTQFSCMYLREQIKKTIHSMWVLLDQVPMGLK
jgi:hypothetical protein